MEIVLGIILIVASVFLIVAVLMQSGKSHNLSGTIAGGTETFFGKTKGKTIDKLLSKLTTAVAIVFVLLVIVVYVAQPNSGNVILNPDDITIDTSAVEGAVDPADGEVVADDTAAEETTAAAETTAA